MKLFNNALRNTEAENHDAVWLSAYRSLSDTISEDAGEMRIYQGIYNFLDINNKSEPISAWIKVRIILICNIITRWMPPLLGLHPKTKSQPNEAGAIWKRKTTPSGKEASPQSGDLCHKGLFRASGGRWFRTDVKATVQMPQVSSRKREFAVI